MKGTIFSIVRSSVHDGPGIRTVVYFKGCTLRCAWCHNPEGLKTKKEILFYRDKCIGCGRCGDICPECHTEEGFVRYRCRSCGRCAEACPAEALVLSGKEYTPEELFSIIEKDRKFFETSGGGVTFSGGECFVQADFLHEIASLCRSEGIKTMCETALYYSYDPQSEHNRKCLNIAVNDMDEMFCDLKIMDPGLHKKYTGASNETILFNLKYLSEHRDNITVRIPLVPGISDTDDNLERSAEYISSCGRGIRHVELLKYNELAGSKYGPLGLDFTPDFRTEAQNEAFLREKQKKFDDILISRKK